jgi:hypothetical protein
MHAVPREDVAALAGELRSAGAATLADRIGAVGASAAAQAFLHTTGHASRFAAAARRNEPAAAGEVLRQWMPDLLARRGSAALAALSDQARAVLESRELAHPPPSAHPTALRAKQGLEGMAALQTRVAEMRRFEEAAAKLESRWRGNWTALGADLLRRLGMPGS